MKINPLVKAGLGVALFGAVCVFSSYRASRDVLALNESPISGRLTSWAAVAKNAAAALPIQAAYSEIAEESRESAEDELEVSEAAEHGREAAAETAEEAEEQREGAYSQRAEILPKAQLELILGRRALAGDEERVCTYDFDAGSSGDFGANVVLTTSGGQSKTLQQYASALDCAQKHGFYFQRDAALPQIELCEISCQWLRKSRGASLHIKMGKQSHR